MAPAVSTFRVSWSPGYAESLFATCLNQVGGDIMGLVRSICASSGNFSLHVRAWHPNIDSEEQELFRDERLWLR